MGKIKANLALVKALKNWGIDHVYGIPGDSIDSVVDALKQEEENIKFYNVRHEEVATLAAASYTKLTGKIAVSLGIGGPGAVHLLNGMYDAKMDNVPTLVLCGHTNTDQIGSGYFQEVDISTMFQGVAVFNQIITDPARIFDTVNEAIKTAYDEQGVAVLTIPGDILKTEIEDHTLDKPYVYERPHFAAPDDKIKQAAELIEKSENPVVLAGVGTKGAKDEVIDFIEHIQAPTMITLPGKGIVPDTHPQSLGNIGKIGTKPAFEAMKEADLLILLGTNYPYVDYLPDENVPCIQLDLNPKNIGKRYDVDVPLIGHAKDILPELTHACEPVTTRPFLQACQENMENWNKWLEEDRAKDSRPIRPERVMAEIEKVADQDATFSIDVGTSTVWSTRYLRLNHQNKFITSAWLGTMGCALPGAIASKIAFPEREAFAISGDGGFSMVMQDFVTAVYYNLPMIVVVLNNQQLSFIKYEQQAAGELEYAIDLADIDYAKFAESCGGVGFNVTHPDEIAPALAQAKAANKPAIVNIYVDQDAAPLPGQIVFDEMLGYAKFEIRSLIEEGKLEKMPPLKTLIRRVL
ncbi:pyruvate oxidase [Macrococcus hajekii]|uniref:Pyruvate oxidase n=1 Tax=Macrococcus hajekii TaxID=198482 RepID=A0A4R6BJT4_9STAP|nr:pyruvate oxidase [Macrococcus hajekii]TDM01948.1 pyruvate oxidase [Macrococcus hajekii]GGB08770.1 pyruvate oxidase [Macrococcus hajekii]